MFEEHLDRIEAKVDHLTSRGVAADTNIDKLAGRVDGLDSKIEKLTERVDGLDTKVDALDTKVDALDTKVDALDTKVDGLDTKVDHLGTEVERLSSQVGGIDTRVLRLTVMHEDMRDDVKRIADGVSGAGDRFDRIERSVDEIKSTMNSFIQTQSAINGKLRSRDADHERRIVALEKRS